MPIGSVMASDDEPWFCYRRSATQAGGPQVLSMSNETEEEVFQGSGHWVIKQRMCTQGHLMGYQMTETAAMKLLSLEAQHPRQFIDDFSCDASAGGGWDCGAATIADDLLPAEVLAAYALGGAEAAHHVIISKGLAKCDSVTRRVHCSWCHGARPFP